MTDEIYTRIGKKHFMTGPDFFAESDDGRVWIKRDPDQAKIAYALAQYEQARIGPKTNPRFCLTIDANHFHAKPSRGTLWDVLFVAIGGAMWFAILFGLWLVFA